MRTITKNFSGLLLFLLLTISSVNADEINGKVTNSDKEPLLGVSVITNLKAVGTITNDMGVFKLPDMKGITHVTFSSVGYYPIKFKASDLTPEITLKKMFLRSDDIIVTANRAKLGVSPIAFDNFSKEEIKRDYTVGEFPLLLESTPNLHAFSDAGSPLGYSYMKIRGFDDKRISTYINGVPLNDPEDQATYFVDLPDFASNITDIQIQRGVGNSLYGDASFGGSINVVTSIFAQPQITSLSSGFGVYTSDGKVISDIYKHTLEYSSGLIDGQWQFTGRFSKQKTGGYRENSWYEGWAYFFGLGRLDPNMTTELYIYGGPIRMHLSYWGSSREAIELNRRANPLEYENETDNFNQPHYHLHNIYRINDKTTLSNTLYYIRGKGYYEQLKTGRDYSEYNLNNSSDSSSGNLVRQQWVRKNQLGWNPSLVIEHEKGTHTIGGSFYFFESEHWGQVKQAEYLNSILSNPSRYYEYFGDKYVGSFFAQEEYRFTEKLSTQVTAQLRYQRYKFDQTKIGAFAGHDYDIDWLFFSPRIGASYKISDKLSFYGNFAISSRTPTDASIYDANDPFILPSLEVESMTTVGSDTIYKFGDPTAKSERVYDYELGLDYRAEKYQAGVSLFWMDFQDEIIPYGGIDDDGIAITVNADRSVHAGIESNFSYLIQTGLSLSGNFSYNYNRIKNYLPLLDGYEVDFNNKKAAGFPELLGNIIADYTIDKWRITYKHKFIGQQYLELWNIDDLAIDAFSVASLSISYRMDHFLNIGNLIVTGKVDNLFDKKYETSGYGGNYAYDDGTNIVVGGWAEYYVGAERSIFGQIKMELF